jgi:Tfp pilus assembly protein FimT
MVKQAMRLSNHNPRSQDFCRPGTNPYPLTTRRASRNQRQLGFSVLELAIVVGLVVGVLGIAIPSAVSITGNFRISGDGRGVAAALNLARMRAAADFTHARIYVNLSANTYHLEIWNKASSCWQTDGDSNACTQASSPVTALGVGDSFGFGSLSSGPTAATTPAAEPGACTTGVGGASPGTNISNTACVELNSRGYPVNSSNTIIASDAIYIMDSTQNRYSAVAVSISGQPTAYRYGGSSWAQF